MFTGIIETVGTVVRTERRGATQRTRVRAPEILTEVRLGDSISLDGACQTVVAMDAESFEFDSVEETLRLTNIGEWRTGTRVNLERSLRVGSRLDGHWVTGHVDGRATILDRSSTQHAAEFWLRAPDDLARQIARKGSVALDGVSLTVTDVNENEFGVAIIPFTLDHTTLKDRQPGDKIHIETDVLAKYVERLLGSSDGGTTARERQVTMELLTRAGFAGGGEHR